MSFTETMALVSLTVSVVCLPINLHLLGLVKCSDCRRVWRMVCGK